MATLVVALAVAAWSLACVHRAHGASGLLLLFVLLTLVVVTFAVALEISIFGIVAGLGEERRVLGICWAFLGASWLLLQVAFACAAAADIERRAASAAAGHPSAGSATLP